MIRLWLGLAILCAGCDGCRNDAETAASDAEAPEPLDAAADVGIVPKTREPLVDAAAHLDPIDPACADAVDLERALGDARCAIPSSTAKALRAAIEGEGTGKAPLAQEAKLEGDHVVLRLVNKGTKPLVLPLSFHPDVPSFSMLVEEDHTLYEMEPTKLSPPSMDAGAGARFARIQLAPGAAAIVKAALPTKIAKRIAPACEAGICGPSKLPAGTYKLHVGQLVTDVESGLPASVEWVVR